MDNEREQLAAAQRELVLALAAGAVPPGFDSARVKLTAESLFYKRMHGVQKMWPGLARGLGGSFEETFRAYARGAALPEDGTFADGFQFALRLKASGSLPVDGEMELLVARTRRGWPVRWARTYGRIHVAIRLPGGVRVMAL